MSGCTRLKGARARNARKLTWVLPIWSALIVIWGVVGNLDPPDDDATRTTTRDAASAHEPLLDGPSPTSVDLIGDRPVNPRRVAGAAIGNSPVVIARIPHPGMAEIGRWSGGSTAR